jgi:hypothetical protein
MMMRAYNEAGQYFQYRNSGKRWLIKSTSRLERQFNVRVALLNEPSEVVWLLRE